MAWPDTYKDRHAALQRGVRLLASHGRDTEAFGHALAADTEATVEFAEAVGKSDELQAAVEEALADAA